MDRLIPKDDFPSASEVGAYDYIMELLSGDRKDFTPVYRAGLVGIEAESQTKFSLSFVQLGPPLQDELLRSIEQGDTRTVWQTSPPEFFQMVNNHCAEAYYGDFGNRNAVQLGSWHMVGFDRDRAWIDHS